MIIKLDNRYKELSTELTKLGYIVVGRESHCGVDAVLYNSCKEGGFLDSINHTSLVSGIHTTGVLLIDIKNKNTVEIDCILKRRLYTPLF